MHDILELYNKNIFLVLKERLDKKKKIYVWSIYKFIKKNIK